MTCYIAFHDWLQATNCSRYKATVLIFKGYMHTCTMLYLLLLHRIFTNHIATICSNSSEMVAQQGLMNPIFAYHTKGLTFLPSRGLYCSWLTARTNLRPDSGQLRSNLQPRYLYHLESRWRNSHVLVHHDPLLSHLPLWCRISLNLPMICPSILLAAQGALCGSIFARRGPSGFHGRASGMAPERVRKHSCPETFTMAEDPKAIAVGEIYVYICLHTLATYIHVDHRYQQMMINFT